MAGIKGKKKSKGQEVQNTLTLKSRKKVFKRKSQQFEEHGQ